MKERVTLTLDHTVSHLGKSAAQARGISFSGYIERLLANATGPRQAAEKDFVSKWAGQFSLADLEGPRGEYLRRKHSL